MAMKRYIIILLISAIAFVLVGLFWQKPVYLPMKDYSANVPAFSDRCYVNEIPARELNHLKIVSLPRHFSKNIHIQSATPFTAFRFLSDVNDNSPFSSWHKSDSIPILIRGRSADFQTLASKFFPAGTYVLPPGGPVAASPLLFHIPAGHTIKTRYYKNVLFPGGIRYNHTRMALYLLLFINYAQLLYKFLIRRNSSE